jgi:ABC-type uncharacterized transport system substrate-binding protein
MKPRAVLILALTLGLLVAPLAAEAQSQRIFRVGYLGGSPPSPGNPVLIGFVRGLREHGYVEGQNLAIEYRWTSGSNEGFPALAAELVGLKVDVIVAHASPAVRAAKEATGTIPIVLLNVADPVGEGLVASLGHPGGNITGVSNQGADFTGKLLELSKETLPRLVRVAVIAPAAEGGAPGPGTRARIKELEAAASALGATIHAFAVHDATDLPLVFAKIATQRADAVVVLPDHVTWFHRAQILELAARSRLPTVCMFQVWGQAGCLIAYGPNLAELWYRAGVFAGKLLKGAKPADLPVEQPTKFELLVNLKTAKALGVTIPPSLLLRADEVIQ